METQTRTFYLRTENNVPVACVAKQHRGDSPFVTLAASICHPNDQFVKKVGRAKAIGRLNRNVENAPSAGDVTAAAARLRNGFPVELHVNIATAVVEELDRQVKSIQEEYISNHRG